LDSCYEHLRHAALHARASAFPLGLGVLIGKGVTAWRRALAYLTSPAVRHLAPHGAAGATAPTATGLPLPGPLAAELVHALAAVAVALAGS
jgi:hypothetical protein